MNNIRTENWQGYNIRFVEQDGEWWAILKDICDALRLRTKDVSQRLDPELMIRVKIDQYSIPGYNVLSNTRIEDGLNDINSRGAKSFWMLAVNEIGIYEALYASRRLEARKFRRWSASVMQKLRSKVGLQQYEVMKMTDPEIQDNIDNILDTLFWDEETGRLMQSVTVQGGDVEQIPFEG